MASKGELTLIVPGARGWDIWRGTKAEGFRLDHRGEEVLASDLKGLSGSELTMVFPVRNVTFAPFMFPSGEIELQKDAATMHMERLGIKVDPFGGQLTDLFNVEQNEESAVLLPVVLSSPEEGTIPTRAPNHFDVSPRMFPLPRGGVTLWMEMGVWVFAFSGHGKVLYAQATTETELGSELVRDIQLARTQLSIQGIHVTESCLVWRSEEGGAPFDSEVDVFGSMLTVPLSVENKPQPILPEQYSELLPADISAERRSKAAKHRSMTIAALVALLYLGVVGYFVWDYVDLKSQRDFVQREADELREKSGSVTNFIRVWDGDLEPMVNEKFYPVDVLHSVAKSLPPGRTVKFKEFAVGPEGDITIEAESKEPKHLTAFRSNLLKSQVLRNDYLWNDPSKNKQTKGEGWGFRLEGTRKL